MGARDNACALAGLATPARQAGAFRALLPLLPGIALVVVPLGGAAASDLDPAFGRGGKVVTPFGNGAFAWDVELQRNGRIVLVGSNSEGAPAFLVARYNANGSLDRRFGSGGKVRTEFGWGDALAIQRDGKLITDFGLHSYATGLAIQGDGKIVAVGSAGGELAAARYLRDGALDPTFDGDGRVVTPFAALGTTSRSSPTGRSCSPVARSCAPTPTAASTRASATAARS